jgi:OmpA-OmpF porin, OOP family
MACANFTKELPMRSLLSKTAIATSLSLVLGAPAAMAQTSGGMMSGLKMPYERGFWGHAGLSLGRSELNVDCPAGGGCDFTDQAFRAFAGGRFNDAIGAEVGYIQFGDFRVPGGEIDSKALDFTLIAGIPFANNWSVFGKLGTVYARTSVTGTPPAGTETGKQSGWGPRFGFGVQMGLTENWALRADLDRYRMKFPGDRDTIDTLTLGAQYTFR